MGSMPPQDEATALPTPANITPSPSSPAEAFAQFVELIRKSPVTLVGVPADDIFNLLRPFIVNPARNQAAVRQIAEAFGAVEVAKSLAPMLKMIRWIPGNKKLKGTMEQFNPNLVERLRALETMLKTNLLPGSVVVYLKPVQYLETPQGYGLTELHRYRVIVQTLVEPSEGDALDAISIQLTATSDNAAEVSIDGITPQPGFSVVGVKASSGAEHGMQETVAEKESVTGEITGAGAKISSGLETTHSVQESTLISIGTERSLARVEQYLIARKAGNRVTWRALAGIGPIDASGLEYVADLLVPDSVREILIRVEAKVDWTYAGTIPTDVQKTLVLPRPQRLSGKS
jgi:hypothetical protein